MAINALSDHFAIGFWYAYAYIFTKRHVPQMDERVLDVIIGLSGFLVLIVLLAVLPIAMPGAAGAAYLVAIVVFIVFLSGAGYLVNEKIT
jgi:cell division protein FtsW (lipid II flippase)